MNYEIIDNYIDYIVMNFEYNDFIKNVICKLNKMYERKDIIIGENYLEIKNSFFSRRILLDKNQKCIEIYENGDKKEGQNLIHFSKNSYYNVIDGEGICVNVINENKKTGNTICNLKKTIAQQYIKGFNVASNIEWLEERETGLKIRKISNYGSKLEYNFPNGISIKQSKENGSTSYYKKTINNNYNFEEVLITEKEYQYIYNKNKNKVNATVNKK